MEDSAKRLAQLFYETRGGSGSVFDGVTSKSPRAEDSVLDAGLAWAVMDKTKRSEKDE